MERNYRKTGSSSLIFDPRSSFDLFLGPLAVEYVFPEFFGVGAGRRGGVEFLCKSIIAIAFCNVPSVMNDIMSLIEHTMTVSPVSKSGCPAPTCADKSLDWGRRVCGGSPRIERNEEITYWSGASCACNMQKISEPYRSNQRAPFRLKTRTIRSHRHARRDRCCLDFGPVALQKAKVGNSHISRTPMDYPPYGAQSSLSLPSPLVIMRIENRYRPRYGQAIDLCSPCSYSILAHGPKMQHSLRRRF